MPRKTVNAVDAPVFILPNLESDVTDLDEFVSRFEIPVGIPFSQLGVEISLCKDLVFTIISMFQPGISERPELVHIVSAIRLVVNRLNVVKKVAEHGLDSCQMSVSTNIMDGYKGLAIAVQNQHGTIEEAVNMPIIHASLPLNAILNSISSCIGVLGCIYYSGRDSTLVMKCKEFDGLDENLIDSCLILVDEQLRLVDKAIGSAANSGFWADGNSTKESGSMKDCKKDTGKSIEFLGALTHNDVEEIENRMHQQGINRRIALLFLSFSKEPESVTKAEVE